VEEGSESEQRVSEALAGFHRRASTGSAIAKA